MCGQLAAFLRSFWVGVPSSRVGIMWISSTRSSTSWALQMKKLLLALVRQEHKNTSVTYPICQRDLSQASSQTPIPMHLIYWTKCWHSTLRQEFLLKKLLSTRISTFGMMLQTSLVAQQPSTSISRSSRTLERCAEWYLMRLQDSDNTSGSNHLNKVKTKVLAYRFLRMLTRGLEKSHDHRRSTTARAT